MPEETVLVTGGSSGIGRATARAFLDEEWTVYATARDRADLDDLSAMGCRAVELDVRDPEECRTAVERVIDDEGRIDCLVNNAGYAQPGAVEDVPPRLVHRQFDVNVYGPHRLVRWALPHMREAGDGTIVNVSSVVGRVAVPGVGVYSASKFALEALSDALRQEVAHTDVDVVLVEPGPVETGFQERALDEIEAVEESDTYAHLYRLYDDWAEISDGAASPPREVADAILEAGSTTNPAARYPVGQTARLAVFARFLPDRWRDTAFSLARRLPGLPG